jgi:hypothetical protein
MFSARRSPLVHDSYSKISITYVPSSGNDQRSIFIRGISIHTSPSTLPSEP